MKVRVRVSDCMCVCILAGARTCVRLQMCMCVGDGVRGISSGQHMIMLNRLRIGAVRYRSSM